MLNAEFAIDFHTGTTGFEVAAFNCDPGALLDAGPLQPAGPVGRSIRTASDTGILDFTEPFSGRDLGRLDLRHIVDGRQSNMDRRAHDTTRSGTLGFVRSTREG